MEANASKQGWPRDQKKLRGMDSLMCIDFMVTNISRRKITCACRSDNSLTLSSVAEKWTRYTFCSVVNLGVFEKINMCFNKWIELSTGLITIQLILHE